MKVHITQLYRDENIIRAVGTYEGDSVSLAQSETMLKMAITGDDKRPYHPTRRVNPDGVARGVSYTTGTGENKQHFKRLSDVVVNDGTAVQVHVISINNNNTKITAMCENRPAEVTMDDQHIVILSTDKGVAPE